MRGYHSSATDTGTFRVIAVRGGTDFAITWRKFRLANGRLPWRHDANSRVNICSWHAGCTRTWRAHLERIIHCQANMIVSDEIHTANFVAAPGTETCE
jgi:hypothetical protein